MNRIKFLEEKITLANQSYYDVNLKPIMSDDEFNSYFEELKILDPFNNLIININKANVDNKVKHITPMLSLGKVKANEVYKIEELLKSGKLVGSVKCDGMACELTYSDGNLIQAVTRGDGEYGEDITDAMLNSEYRKVLHISGKYRGELVIYKNNFDDLCDHYKNLNLDPPTNIRNAVQGVIKRKLTQFINFIMYGTDRESMNYIDIFNQSVFNTPFPKLLNNMNDVNKFIDVYKENEPDVPYQIDGLVFRVNNNKMFESMGYTTHHPKGALAWKPSDVVYEAIVDYIETKCNRTGKISYVAVFKEPINISNSNIQKATLHNYGIVEKNQIRKGSIIYISKSNDVIPYFNSVKSHSEEPFVLSDVCPCCKSKLIIESNGNAKEAYCVNPNCDAQLIEKFIHGCQVLDIDGLSDKTAERLYKYMKDDWNPNLLDIFSLTVSELLEVEGFASKSASNMYYNIQKKSKIKINKFIQALNIKGVGESLSKNLCIKYPNLDDWIGADSNLNFDDIDLVGDKTRIILNQNIEYIRNAMYYYVTEVPSFSPDETKIDIINYEVNNDTTYSNLNVVISGSFPISRPKIKKWLENKGAKVSSGVSGKTTHLILGEKAGASKVHTAKMNGTKMVSSLKPLNMTELFDWINQ